MSSEPHQRSTYIYGIDVLRFACALMVTLFHLGFASWASPIYLRPYQMPSIEYLVQPGWVGVEIFFVISGFVVVNSASSATPIQFLKARALRLYPAVWLCASLTVLFVARHGISLDVVKKYIRSILLLPIGHWIDVQYWTLANEILFYGLIFLVLAFSFIRRIDVVATVLAVIGAVYVGLLVTHPDSLYLLKLTAPPYRALPVFMACHFAIGIYISLWARRQMTRLTWCGLAIAIVTGIVQIDYSAMLTNGRTIGAAGHDFPTIVPIFIWLAGLVVIFASVGYRERIASLNPRMLNAIRFMGLMTYPLYLLHFEIGVQLMDALVSWGTAPLVALTLAIAAVCLISAAVCGWGEPPIRRALRSALDAAERGSKRVIYRFA